MIRTMENEFLRVQIEDKGAELISIFDKEKNREIMWEADPAYWGRHAPVLFPNVGRHFGNTYTVGGNTYPSKQHGFARDSEFTPVRQTDSMIVHELKSSVETKASYPFDFVFQAAHLLEGRELTVAWTVFNESEQTMYFTIGGHPAFRVPVLPGTDYSDYSLFFDSLDSLSYVLLDCPTGTTLGGQEKELVLKNGTLPLDTHLFDNDALVFDRGQIARVGILLPDGTPHLELRCQGFPSFGIWSVPGAPFVCLEPWMGRCDDYGYEGTLEEKPGINSIEPGKVFEKSYVIKIY